MAEVGSAFISLLPSMRGFGQQVEREGSGPMANAGKKFGSILSGALIAGTAAAGAAIAYGVVKAMEQEVSTDRMAAALGLSPQESERLGGVAGDLYANAYGESFGDVTSAVESVYSSIEGMTSASTKELEGVTEAALNFASAFEVDVSRASQVAGQLISTGLATDATQAFDLLTAASQRVPASVREDVLDATEEYGQFFSQLGFNGEQAFAVLVDGSERGMYGIDKAGDALKEFSIRATDMSTSSLEAYDAIGLSADDMADKLLAGGDTAQGAFQQIIDGLLDIEDPTARANEAIKLFGTPLEDLSVNEIPTFLQSLQDGSDAMSDFEGSTEKMGDTLNDNASARITAFKRQVEQAFVEFIGGQVIPKLSEWGAAIEKYLGPALEWLQGAIQDARPWINNLATEIGRIWEESQPTLSRLSTFFSETFESIKSIVGSVVSIVSSLWDRFGENIVTTASTSLGNVMTFLQGAFTYIRGIFQIFSSLLKGDWSGVWEGIKTAVSGAVQMILGIVRQFGNLLRSAFSSISSIVTGIFSGLWNGITSLVSGGVERVVGAVRGVPGKIKGLASSFLEAGKSVMRSLLSGLSSAGDFVADIAGNVWSAIKGLLNSGIDAVNNALNITIDPPGPLGPWHFDLGFIPRFEKGTNFAPGGVALVGEAGPELVHLPRGSRVVPNHRMMGELRELPSGGGQAVALSIDYDALAEAMARRPNVLSIDDRTGATLMVRWGKAEANFA